MRGFLRVLGSLSFVFVLGCPSDPVETTDAPAPRDGGGGDARGDGGSTVDALVGDVLVVLDAPVDDDAGGSTDDAGGTTDDAGGGEDGGVTDDAGASTGDAGGAMDAGGATDAGATADAGSSTDAGSGTDAPVTTCSLGVTPGSSPLSGTFTFTGASNGSSCSVRLDGGPTLLVVPCNASMDVTAGTFGVGPHMMDLLVGAGPGGPTSCSTTFTVTADPPSTTTCSISVTPESGPTSASFTATWASDGTGCTLSVNGLSIGTVACTSSMSAAGTVFGTGTHTVQLSVSGGPGGPTSCSDTVTITP